MRHFANPEAAYLWLECERGTIGDPTRMSEHEDQIAVTVHGEARVVRVARHLKGAERASAVRLAVMEACEELRQMLRR